MLRSLRSCPPDPTSNPWTLTLRLATSRPLALLVAVQVALALPLAAQEPAPAPAPAPAAAAPEVTLELIMADPDWIGNPPERPYFADNGQSIFYWQKRPGEEQRDLVEIDLTGRLLRTVALTDLGSVDAPGGAFSPDHKRKVFSREGDLFVRDLTTGALQQLTRTLEAEREPRFMADGHRIAFRRGDALFVRDLEGGLEVQPAELVLGEDPAAKKPAEDFLSRQQERLFEFIREGQKKKDAARDRDLAERRADPTRVPPPFYLGKDVEVRGQALSPSGDWLLVALGKKDENLGKQDKMASWVTASGYVEVRDVRPKVGTAEGVSERLLLLDLVRHESHELSLAELPGIKDDPLASLREKAEEAKKAHQQSASKLEEEDLPPEVVPVAPPRTGLEDEGGGEEPPAAPAPAGETAAAEAPPAAEAKEEAEKKPRPVSFRDLQWNDDGSRVVVSIFSLDNKDRWLAAVDLDAKRLVPVHHLHDEAWLGWDFDELGWMPDGRSLYYLSEETGYSQLYLAPIADGPEAPHRRLTQGDSLVSNVQPSRDGAMLYYTANAGDPGVYEAWRVAVATGEAEQLTNLGGINEWVLSPDEKHLVVSHSEATRPPELYLQRAEPGATASPLTHTVSETFAAIDWTAPEFVTVPSTHGARPIHSRLYLPRERRPGPQPAVLFVHGAGYLQNAHQGWSDYFREFMFHSFLTRHGYTVLDMDYRASAGYGRDWRTAIYRQMGTPELEDLEDGVAWLVASHGVDPQHVGVYGGSYGGFMTLMALFKRPGLFAAGAALRPVTDWAHYNHGYTSAILNTPEIDPEAYQRSSPIEFADGLDDPLLICAPMQDDNVFFQDTVRLAQKLIELEKQDWDVAIFPVEPHGFRVPSSWLNEYRRIWKLFEREVR